MISEFIQRFDTKREEIKDKIRKAKNLGYEELLRFVIEAISQDDSCSPDPDRIHCMDDGEYQGTYLFVIAAGGYLPSDYWAVKVYYGSCSGCDTLQAIESDGTYAKLPNESQVEQYFTLCLHMIQQMVEIGGEGV